VACRAVAGGAGAERADSVPSGPARAELLALQAALAGGDDEAAARLIEALVGAELARAERAQVEGARKVLRGRTLVAGLEFALASEELVDTPGRFELVLRARNQNAGALTLLLPPADLRRQRATIDARGAEGLELDSKLCTVFAELEVPAGRESRWVILTYELPLGRALAVRERWRLVTRSGCARERASPRLVASPDAAAKFVAELQDAARPAPRALLEAALAIPPDEREAALAALAPLVAELARHDPERVLAAEPALRWLTQNRDLGADPAAWARYLAQRSGPESSEHPRLDLPAHPRAR
jgi:hypothetical protein